MLQWNNIATKKTTKKKKKLTILSYIKRLYKDTTKILQRKQQKEIYILFTHSIILSELIYLIVFTPRLHTSIPPH